MFKKTQNFDDLYEEKILELWEALKRVDFNKLFHYVSAEKIYGCIENQESNIKNQKYIPEITFDEQTCSGDLPIELFGASSNNEDLEKGKS